MTAKCSCGKCKFAEKKALKTWNQGKQTPYCTFPGFKELNREGDCQSGREN
jgi:hypothetical protein